MKERDHDSWIGRWAHGAHTQVLVFTVWFHCKVNFRKKKYSCKIIFGQTKLNENNFLSRVWCALIEEIAGDSW